MSEFIKDAEARMQKTIESVKSDFASVRAGRANASVLDRIQVEYYGTPTPLNQVASISSPDPRQLVVQPWDSSLLRAIEKAIQTSELGINPQNDGKVIRLTFPQLTEERRRELTKQVHKYAEGGKVAVRNIRRDVMDKIKAAKKKSEITEDGPGEEAPGCHGQVYQEAGRAERGEGKRADERLSRTAGMSGLSLGRESGPGKCRGARLWLQKRQSGAPFTGASACFDVKTGMI